MLTLCPAALEAGAAALPEAARLEPMPPSVFVCAISREEGEAQAGRPGRAGQKASA